MENTSENLHLHRVGVEVVVREHWSNGESTEGSWTLDNRSIRIEEKREVRPVRKPGSPDIERYEPIPGTRYLSIIGMVSEGGHPVEEG